MSIVAYIARDPAGTNMHGTSSEGTPSIIDATSAKDISLNLSPSDVESYARRGSDLYITLNDGSIVQVDGFYDAATTGSKNLFLSEDGTFIEVVLEDKAEGMLFASYEPLDLAGKWSAYDDMVFLGVDRIEPVVAPLAAPLFGGLGAAGAAAAVAGVAAVSGGGGSGGGGGGGGDDDTTTPTVNDADGTYLVPEGDPDGVTISGTGETGSTVEVTIEGVTQTTTVGDDGTWSVDFPTDDLPGDGVYETVVEVVAPDGTVYDLDGPTIDVDMTPPEVEITDGTQSVGDLVNGDEQSSGTVISGTGEAGATVTLEIDGATQTTTVADDGTWSVTFSSDQIATGEYETDITITTTDPHGNSTVTTDVLEVDTLTSVDIDSGLSGGDDIVTSAEAAAGVAITGTAEAGASVEVTIEGVTQTTTADSDGNWSVTYAAGTLPDGEYSTEISVTSTDLAGNTATDTSSIYIDTSAGTVALSLDPIEGDDIINADERSDGVTITGTATPGEEVTVTLGSASGTVIADSDGNWSYDFTAGEIPTGTETLDVTATITDDVGNTASDSDTVALDTEVEDYVSDATQASDDTVNLSELSAGFELTGTVEAGSTVEVTVEGVTRSADVDDDGNWTVTFDGDDLPDGEYTTQATITATDAAGNVATLTQSFDVDTEFNTPEVEFVTVNTDDEIRNIEIADTDDTNTVNILNDDGTLGDTVNSSSEDGTYEEFTFSPVIPDGTNLIVTAEDAAGNTSSTLVLFEDNASENGTIDHGGLSGVNVDALDLEYAANTDITLTEADILALSGNSDALTIRGGSDDTVRVSGATDTGETEFVDGTEFAIYTIGDDGATLLIEDEVNVVI